ncbi:MAG: thioredoxin family protein [Mesonia hippocampi]|uniref:thioredoxin family protein n=1 Tax=Mesonia hippocampi TaxID=1628250 RepID=UPI003F95A77E
METLALNTLVETAAKNAYTYDEYREMMSRLLAQGKVTGEEQSEALLAYAKLNERRMQRWEKTLKITEEDQKRMKSFSGDMLWLVISESWCGDAAHNLPVMKKLADLNPAINLKVVLRDENLTLMDEFLTNGGRSIPKLIMFDAKAEKVLGSWGPRPEEATRLVLDYKEKHGKIDEQIKEDLQRWYNKDKGQVLIAEILNMLGV